jgi:hypothetical protein
MNTMLRRGEQVVFVHYRYIARIHRREQVYDEHRISRNTGASILGSPLTKVVFYIGPRCAVSPAMEAANTAAQGALHPHRRRHHHHAPCIAEKTTTLPHTGESSSDERSARSVLHRPRTDCHDRRSAAYTGEHASATRQGNHHTSCTTRGPPDTSDEAAKRTPR